MVSSEHDYFSTCTSNYSVDITLLLGFATFFYCSSLDVKSNCQQSGLTAPQPKGEFPYTAHIFSDLEISSRDDQAWSVASNKLTFNKFWKSEAMLFDSPSIHLTQL